MIKKTFAIACLGAFIAGGVLSINIAAADGGKQWTKHRQTQSDQQWKGYRNGQWKPDKRHHGRYAHRGHRHGSRAILWYPLPHRPVYSKSHRHQYPKPRRGGFGHVHWSGDAYKWIAFTTITLRVLDHLDRRQQRAHESAQIGATRSPIGKRVRWQSDGARGYVVALSEGVDRSGRLCREFAHKVSYRGKQRKTSAVACRTGDGVWKVTTPRRTMAFR